MLMANYGTTATDDFWTWYFVYRTLCCSAFKTLNGMKGKVQQPQPLLNGLNQVLVLSARLIFKQEIFPNVYLRKNCLFKQNFCFIIIKSVYNAVLNKTNLARQRLTEISKTNENNCKRGSLTVEAIIIFINPIST